MTITIDETVYQGLYATIGEGKMSQFIENLVKPHVLQPDLRLAYQQMTQDKHREAQAMDWIEEVIGDVNDATR